MKTILKTFTVVLFILNYSCQAQMVKTTKDLHKLKENEQQFVNQPLKNLLKEIGPMIKTANGTNAETNYFAFWFRTLEQRKKNEGNYDDRTGLFVYVKENIDWDFEKRPKGNELKWGKEEIEKYGNLTVIRIKVINQPKE